MEIMEVSRLEAVLQTDLEESVQDNHHNVEHHVLEGVEVHCFLIVFLHIMLTLFQLCS